MHDRKSCNRKSIQKLLIIQIYPKKESSFIMKNHILKPLIIALLFFTQTLSTNKTSQTFMFPRPIYNNLAAQNGPWLTFRTQEYQDSGFSFEIVGAHQDGTTKNNHDGYFSIDCKENLIFAGDQNSLIAQRDVRAEYFNLPDNFSGILQINAAQKQHGFWLTCFQKLGPLFDIPSFYHVSLGVRIPVIWVENTLNLCQLSEINSENTSNQPANIIQALNQKELNYAKMLPGKHKDEGIPEVRFDLRSTFIQAFPFHLAAYSGFIIPTFRRVTPEFIFEPLVGINRHPALVAGANFMFPLSSDDCPWLICFFFDAENRFYIKSSQCRTFDLRNLDDCQQKQWSRYLKVRKEGDEETIFAANVLTLPVIAKPDNRANLDGGFRYFSGNFEAEVGYQLWVQGDERIELKTLNCQGQSFKFENYGIAGTGTGSASKSTINTLAPNDDEFITIKENDLDLLSGAARGVSTNMIYASLSYTSLDEFTKTPLMISVGAFYEAPKNNAALTSWGVWGKAGTRF